MIHEYSLTAYVNSMKAFLAYVGKAVFLIWILMTVPCILFWFHTGNSRGLEWNEGQSKESVGKSTQILVDSRPYSVEKFLISMISVDYSADMDMETLKTLAVAARSKLYAHLQKHTDSAPVSAEELEVTWQTLAEMIVHLEETGETKHWSVGYQRMKEAVQKTAGQYLIWSGQPADVMWHMISAGTTRSYAGNETGKWDGTASFCPELKSMEGKDRFLTESVTLKTYDRREIAELIWEIAGTEEILLEEERKLSSWFSITDRDAAGYIRTCSIGTQEITGEEAANLLHLSSACFYLTDQDNDCLKILVFGTGSGYGMSLAGADAMAKQGANYEDILSYYFPVCKLQRNYP